MPPRFRLPSVRPRPTPYTGRGLYAPDDELGHVLRPNRVSGDVRTNSWGFRDHEYPVDKPRGAYRIVGVGANNSTSAFNNWPKVEWTVSLPRPAAYAGRCAASASPSAPSM